ncbi:MAG: hypothetical protein ACR2RV_04970, partial [Verrucomicrobiales bacterium]
SPLRKSLLGSPLTRWMFRDEKLDAVTVIGAIAVLAFSALAIRAGTQHLGEGNGDGAGGETAEEPPKAFDPKDPELVGGAKTDVALTQIAEVLDTYSKLETWQERLPYYRNPERVKPLMEAYYKKHPDGPMRNLTINQEVSFIQREGETYVLMQGAQLSPNGEEGERKQVLLLAELRKGDPCALFDWEVLVNYQPVSWEEFVASKSTTSSPFRVRVIQEEYYVKPFMDKEEYVSFGLVPLGQDRTVYGFARRGSDLEKQLSANVSRELKGHRAMILNLRFPENAKYDNVLEIESITADSWLGK